LDQVWFNLVQSVRLRTIRNQTDPLVWFALSQDSLGLVRFGLGLVQVLFNLVQTGSVWSHHWVRLSICSSSNSTGLSRLILMLPQSNSPKSGSSQSIGGSNADVGADISISVVSVMRALGEVGTIVRVERPKHLAERVLMIER
jgi:hypothetical protein